MAFPPVPVYPNAIDSDYTLFLVHDTSESRLCKDNAAWSGELEIVPVGASEAEIWADNGFANVSGELFYYESVEKDVNGKVYKLKDCARNLAGTKTKYNPKGTWVRGFVIAEHHNQIANAILRVEDFVGFNFDPRQATLDWRIRNLRELSVIFDDFNCPDIDFTFNITSNDPVTGIVAQYEVQVTPPGGVSNFRLDFGDGTFTVSELQGTHRYALNATIDPIVTVSNDQCQMIQSPVTRDNPQEPPEIITQVFDIPVPEIPPFPDFTFVPCEVPEPEINLPPLVPPCVSLTDLSSFPSLIVGPDINLVSQVDIIGPTNPVNILYSVVTIEGGFELPSIIFVDVPPTIVIDPPIPPTIVVVASSANSLVMGLDWTGMPDLKVAWDDMPAMQMQMVFPKQAKVQSLSFDSKANNEFGEEFADIFQANNQVNVEYEQMGIPSQIEVLVPEFPKIEVDSTSIPKTIEVTLEEAKLPEVFRTGVFRIEGDIPSELRVIHDLPKELKVVTSDDFPRQLELVASKDLPRQIDLVMSKPIPETIFVDAQGIPKKIMVEGFSDIITVKGLEPFMDGLKLLPPETMPPVEMVYNGPPIEMKLVLDSIMSTDESGNKNCVMIVPCTP